MVYTISHVCTKSQNINSSQLYTMLEPPRVVYQLHYFSYMWWSVLLVEEAVVPRENHRSVASH